MPRTTRSGYAPRGKSSIRTTYGIRSSSAKYSLRHGKEIVEKMEAILKQGLVIPYDEYKKLQREKEKKKIKERGYQEWCEKCWKDCKVFGGKDSSFFCSDFSLKYSLGGKWHGKK